MPALRYKNCNFIALLAWFCINCFHWFLKAFLNSLLQWNIVSFHSCFLSFDLEKSESLLCWYEYFKTKFFYNDQTSQLCNYFCFNSSEGIKGSRSAKWSMIQLLLWTLGLSRPGPSQHIPSPVTLGPPRTDDVTARGIIASLWSSTEHVLNMLSPGSF